MEKTYYLPLNKYPNNYTTDRNIYFNHWHSLINPLEKLFNLKCTSYDPSLKFVRKINGKFLWNETIEITPWLAQKIIEKVAKKI